MMLTTIYCVVRWWWSSWFIRIRGEVKKRLGRFILCAAILKVELGRKMNGELEDKMNELPKGFFSFSLLHVHALLSVPKLASPRLNVACLVT